MPKKTHLKLGGYHQSLCGINGQVLVQFSLSTDDEYARQGDEPTCEECQTAKRERLDWEYGYKGEKT